MKNLSRSLSVLSFIFLISAGCSSTPEVKNQKYAELKSETTFEYEFPVVWKAVETAVREYKITDRDPKEVNEVEIKKLRERMLKTDWIFSKSRDKFIEYKVNNLPRKKYLQTRIKYDVMAESVIGGVKVTVAMDEEVERLNEDGSPAGYESAAEKDSSRANDLLNKIRNAILSAP